MTMFRAFFFVLIAKTIAAMSRKMKEPQRFYELKRPDLMKEYIETRESCEWKPFNGLLLDCKANVQECKIYADVPEGRGFYIIYRVGPFTTTGGTQRYGCNLKERQEVSSPGTYITRAISGPVDAITHSFVGYPPIHTHHAVTSPAGNGDDMPDLPSGIRTQFPFLVPAFGGTSNTFECHSDQGGTACFARVLPEGFAIPRYQNLHGNFMKFLLEDIRALGSPAISTSMEYAIFHLEKPFIPVVPAISSLFTVRGGGSAGTWAVPYNTPVITFETYYIPVNMRVLGIEAHIHGELGDELWVLRGRQEDLGVPLSLRRPIYYNMTLGHDPYYDAIPLSEAFPTDTLESLKDKMEENLRIASESFDLPLATGEDLELERKFHYSSNQPFTSSERSEGSSLDDDLTTTAIRAKVGTRTNKITVTNPAFHPYNPNVDPPSPVKPGILCKYYGNPELYDAAKIAQMSREKQREYAQHLARRRATGNPLAHPEDSSEFLNEIVTEGLTDGLTKDGRIADIDAPFLSTSHSSSFGPSSTQAGDIITRPASVAHGTITSGETSVTSQHDLSRALADADWLDDLPTNTNEAIFKPVHGEDQAENFFSGVEPGFYYKYPISSMDLKDPRYQECASFKLEAGEYLTLMYFNTPQKYPPDGEFNNAISWQHVRLNHLVYMPDMDGWFSV